MAVSLQIFVQCFFAQRLIDSSTSIATSAYNSQWYNSSVKTQRSIILIMIRAQKAQTVTAWKFFDVSLETFQWVINIFRNILESLINFAILDHFNIFFIFFDFTRNVWLS
ncbi:hypothetical protein ACKWTF_007187 [Chironomus riparius]